MEELMNVASYIYNRYEDEYNTRIDEMKLHKLLYFAQRESFVQRYEPLFSETFYGWKYGPVLKEIREAYKLNNFYKHVSTEVIVRIKPIIDRVFREYADRDSWSLSRLTHGEISWKNSYHVSDGSQNSDNPIDIKDIAKDADRVRTRRLAFDMLHNNGVLA